MADSVTLTSAMRANLTSLQATATMMGQTQQRLSTGLKVNSAIDNPASYFAARGENQRADLLSGLKDNISEAIQTVKAANTGVTAILSTLESLRGVITQARSALNDTVNSGTTLSGLASQYDNLIGQLNNVAGDSSYKGINFLSGTSQQLTVNFNENATTSLTMSGFDASSSGLGLSGGVAGTGTTTVGTLTSADLSTSTSLNNMETKINSAISTLQTQSSNLASNLSVLSMRQTFITDMVNTLRDGATNLTVADTNAEGANMLMLQTRNQLGTTALSLSSQAAQSVLRLF